MALLKNNNNSLAIVGINNDDNNHHQNKKEMIRDYDYAMVMMGVHRKVTGGSSRVVSFIAPYYGNSCFSVVFPISFVEAKQLVGVVYANSAGMVPHRTYGLVVVV